MCGSLSDDKRGGLSGRLFAMCRPIKKPARGRFFDQSAEADRYITWLELQQRPKQRSKQRQQPTRQPKQRSKQQQQRQQLERLQLRQQLGQLEQQQQQEPCQRLVLG
jgi:hypothetical protein